MNKLNTRQVDSSEKGETFFDPSETVTIFNTGDNSRQTDRLRLIYQEEPLTLTSYLIVTLIMTIMAWPYANQYLLSAWFISTSVILSIRFLLSVSFHSRLDKNIRPHKWRQRFHTLNFLTGLIIGCSGLLPLSADNHQLTIVLAVGLITLSSISVSTLSIEKNIFSSFMLPALIPITANTLFSGTRTETGIALLLIIFSVTILLLSRRNRQNIETSFDMRYENATLLESISESKRQLERKNSELEKMATEDYLTGLANRRYGDKHLRSEWSKAIRHQRCISMIMLDIDNFKPYNDHYGHQMGDECLKIVAQALKQTLSRPGDLAVRYGGEEFLLILPDTDIEGSLRIARRFQSVLGKIHIPHEYSDISDHITASCGISCIVPQRTDKISKLIRQADTAMYKAKFSGGNCTVSFE